MYKIVFINKKISSILKDKKIKIVNCNNYFLKKDIMHIQLSIYNDLKSERKNLNNMLYLNKKVFISLVDANIISTSTNLSEENLKSDVQLKNKLFNLMFAEYNGILTLIDGLIFSLNISENIDITNDNESLEYYSGFNPVLLALIMRTILEESVQIRHIFYDDNFKSYNKDLMSVSVGLKPVQNAFSSLSKKAYTLKKVNDDINYSKKDNWLIEVKHINNLIRCNLPSQYLTLYSKLCKYSHNSKMFFNLEDCKDLLLDLKSSILPSISEFNYIFSSYFEDEFFYYIANSKHTITGKRVL